MKQFVALFACCALVTLTVGCSQNQSLVRGQTPMEYQDTPGYGPMYFNDSIECPSCPQNCQKDWWRPTHHHTWEYHAPQDLVYPAANQPPAVQQYPYYTVKGPSDFFMK
ncbi:MAG: hypothetical protein ACYTGL_17500 [Planctomycetota bacterium]|jgi:hypothetical protein